MHDFYDLSDDFLCLTDFDNGLIKTKNKIIYNSKDIEPFGNSKKLINKQLNNYFSKNKKIIICMSNRENVNKLIEELENPNLVFTSINEIIATKINVIVKKIKSGFELPEIVVISENEIFNKKNIKPKYKSRFKIGTKISDVTKINVGDYIVHEIHGIARYTGIKKIKKIIYTKII